MKCMCSLAVSAVALMVLSPAERMHAADHPPADMSRQIQSSREVRNDWQRTQEGLQKQLADKQAALEKLERASDLANRDETIEKNSEVMLQSGKSGYLIHSWLGFFGLGSCNSQHLTY